MTASLGNFIASLFAGAVIALAIGGVLVFISRTDRVTRDFQSYCKSNTSKYLKFSPNLKTLIKVIEIYKL